MALQIGLGVLVLVTVLVLLINKRPAKFRIARSAEIDAPAPAVFALMDDFHAWAKWSPWEKLDPTMKKTFHGPASGVGAGYTWAGNRKAGQGRMTIVECKPSERLIIKLEFLKPFTATNQTTFNLSPTAKGTTVQWIMEGDSNFAHKALSLFMNMDDLVGKQFEEGLSNLSAAASG
jgi:uncharacterized protein YndB with AHSA1/START domain